MTQHLFTPLTLRDTSVRNRIWVSPMCQYSAEDGYARDWHLVHLGSRAVGGAGLVMAEATAVTPEGRISYADLGIWDHGHVDMLRRVTQFISEHGAVPAIQLAHAGRKAGTAAPWEDESALESPGRSWTPVSPTATPFFSGDSGRDRATPRPPRALSTREVRQLVYAFVTAARRAVDAGFRAVEIHGAHGYLIHQFLSPLANDRHDEYGGEFSGRIRFLMEIIRGVREAVGEGAALLLRISATDWREDGWTVEDSVRLAELAKEAGVDLVDCSSGGILPDVPIPVGTGFQTPLAAQVRAEAGVPAGAVGLITSPAQADQIIRTGQADVVLLAREFLRDPYWPYRAARALGHDPDIPAQYARAW